MSVSARIPQGHAEPAAREADSGCRQRQARVSASVPAPGANWLACLPPRASSRAHPGLRQDSELGTSAPGWSTQAGLYLEQALFSSGASSFSSRGPVSSSPGNIPTSLHPKTGWESGQGCPAHTGKHCGGGGWEAPHTLREFWAQSHTCLLISGGIPAMHPTHQASNVGSTQICGNPHLRPGVQPCQSRHRCHG